jgi:hypothetical protein
MSVVEQLKSKVEEVRSRVQTIPILENIRGSVAGQSTLLRGQQGAMFQGLTEKLSSIPVVSNLKNAASTAKTVGIGKGGIVEGIKTLPTVQRVQSRLRSQSIAPQTFGGVAEKVREVFKPPAAAQAPPVVTEVKSKLLRK